MIERNTAYGLKSELVGENAWAIKIAALSDRAITVKLTGETWIASCTIGGTEECQLLAVHVVMKSSWGMPKVDYVELFGADGMYEKKQLAVQKTTQRSSGKDEKKQLAAQKAARKSSRKDQADARAADAVIVASCFTDEQFADKDAQLADKDALLAEQATQLAVLARRVADLEAAQKHEQPPLWDEQLAQQAAQLSEQAVQLAQKDARIAALEAGGAAPPQSPTTPARERALSQDERTKQAEKDEHERAFENSLEPQLRTWMGEAPTMVAAALLADKAQVLLLEVDLATSATRAELVALVPAIAERLRATATPYTTEDQIQRLAAITVAGNALYFGMYNNILTQQVVNNDGFAAFCKVLGAIVPNAAFFPQRTKDLLAIYDTAGKALPLFGEVLEEVAARAQDAGVVVQTRAAPLKHVFRVLQKHATRIDGGAPTEFETACDIVRGSIVCESMGDLLVVLELLLALQKEGKIIIVRVKDRFGRPTAAGWADAMINFVCRSGGAAAAAHVCELQLTHATMLKARKEFGGHAAYAAFREAAELLEFAVGGVLVAAATAAVEPLAVPVAAVRAAVAAALVATEAEEEAALEAVAVAQAFVSGGKARIWDAGVREWVDTGCGWCEAAQAPLAALRVARALVPDGGDAAAAADPLLLRDLAAGAAAAADSAVVELARCCATGAYEMREKVTDCVVAELARSCPHLTSLNVGGCEQVSDSSVLVIARGCPALTSIALNMCAQVSDASVAALARGCPALVSIELEGCDQVSDLSVAALARGCVGLTSINLYGCNQISDASVGQLAPNCPFLTSVNLGWCPKVTPTTLEQLKERLPNCNVTSGAW